MKPKAFIVDYSGNLTSRKGARAKYTVLEKWAIISI
jgi:hypothetical protein